MKNPSSDHYDIAIIGAGPGGYVAAIRAAQLGLKVVCIDKSKTLGGACLNVGCIPSKALLHATEVYDTLLNHGGEQGLEWSQLSFNFTKLMKRKEGIVKGLTDGIKGLFSQHQIKSLQGKAEFVDPHHLRVTSLDGKIDEVEAASIIIATGSDPIALPDLPFDEKQILSSTGALSLSKVPERLVVVGAGVIGVELASVYRRLGSQVTIIEMLDRICPALDSALSRYLLKALEKQGIEFFLSSKVVQVIPQPDEVVVVADLNGKLQNLSAQALLVAVGRRPLTEGLQLDRASIPTDRRGFIPVDENFRTIHPHIYAIGDVIEGVMLAHRASAEGLAVAELIKGEASRVDYMAIPNVIYTNPEVAAVGLTEEEAKQSGIDLMTGTSFFRGNPRARCSGETDGFVKVIGDRRSGRLVGLHIVGAHASELIAEGMLAIQNKGSVRDLAYAPHAHPTLSETIKEAALDTLGIPIHH